MGVASGRRKHTKEARERAKGEPTAENTEQDGAGLKRQRPRAQPQIPSHTRAHTHAVVGCPGLFQMHVPMAAQLPLPLAMLGTSRGGSSTSTSFLCSALPAVLLLRKTCNHYTALFLGFFILFYFCVLSSKSLGYKGLFWFVFCFGVFF